MRVTVAVVAKVTVMRVVESIVTVAVAARAAC